MLADIIRTIDAAYDGRHAWDFLERFWQFEKWFDTPHQRAAAEMARDELIASGLSNARLATYPCDGRTRCQDWMMHTAWDCPAARLWLADSGEVLADRELVQCSTVFWSGPLASADAPAVGEVIDGDKLDKIRPADVKGKYVLTGKMAKEMKLRLLRCKPLAVVSDFLGENPRYTDETVKWNNTWSDSPDGWYFHADDRVMAGFVISPAAGRKLRERMAAGPVKLAGFCQARLYEGSGQNVTAVLEGTDPSREIWIYGHACEQGAHDNCSGVTVLVAALRALKALVVAGRLPRPRFSIRAITTEECIGMLAFATLNDDIRRRALAGLNIDAGGNPAPAEAPYVLNYGPMSSPSFAWPAAAAVAGQVKALAGDAWHVRYKRFIPTADDMIADPNCGVPSLWLGKGGNSLGYHSSADTMAVISPDSLRCNTVLAAAWAYALATMDDALAAEMLPGATAWLEANVLGGEGDAAELNRWAAGRALRDLARFGVTESVFGAAADKYSPADAPPMAGLPTDGPRFIRRTWGTATLETLPVADRKGFTRWSGWGTAALYWTDGRRSLPAIERLAAAECGSVPKQGLAPYFDVCRAAGLLVEDNTDKFHK